MIEDRAREAIARAYPLAQRQAHAEQAILLAPALSLTSCTKICGTYGVPDFVFELKAMKARMFPEFAVNGDAK